LSSGISFVRSLCNSVAIVIAVKSGYGILGLASVTLFFGALDDITRIILAYRIDKRTTISLAYFDRSKFKPFFNYSVFSLIGRLANILRFRLDQLVIGAYVAFSAITHYYVATRLIDYLVSLIGQMIDVVSPVFSQDEGNNDFNGIRSKFLLVSKISVYFSIFFCGLTFLYGKMFFIRWMGPAYTDSYTILWIFLIPFTLHLSQSPAYPMLDGISKHRYYAIPNLVEGIFNLILSLWLVKKYGAVGVAWGTAIPMTVKLLTVQPWFACRSIQIPFSTFVRSQATDMAISSALVLAGWLLVRDSATATYPSMVGCVLVQTAVYWPLMVWIGMSSAERTRLTETIKRAFLLRKLSRNPA
jgi:O-antigen/teichoic acid export membrane protein